MSTLYIHIGFGKCGSSALQSYFTSNPIIKKKNQGSLYYGVIDHNCEVFIGEKLKGMPNTPYGYHSCVSLNHIVNNSRSQNAKFSLDRFFEDVSDEDDLFLSNEGWCNEVDFLKSFVQLLPKNVNIKVLAVVRPPVEWINSAWWQWGAWSDVSFERWARKNIAIVDSWLSSIHEWEAKLSAESIVLPLTSNVITDVSEVIDVVELSNVKSNSSLPEEVLRVFQRNRELRQGPHDSAIEFKLSQKINFSNFNNKTPWVIDSQLADLIISETTLLHQNIYKKIPLKYKEHFLYDKRWIDSSYYYSREVSPSGIIPENKDKDRLIVELIKLAIS
jgi:hypothetical protein